MRFASFSFLCFIPLVGVAAAGEGDELFEKVIRPYLIERCYECHGTHGVDGAHGTREHDLSLDWEGGMREGGFSGPAVVPGKPAESMIMAALRHENDLLMPKGGPKPSAEIVRAFERWIALGAPDPRSMPPSADELAKETSWDAIFARRKQWWSLQPIRRSAVPSRDSGATAWLAASAHPVDRFLIAKLAAAGIEPADEADPDTLLRRATFALTGLPPTPEERAAFHADNAPDRWEKLVDRLIASPHFAEHWARHWLDCVRYCETHGSEGDPAIPHAWRYRDWCVRAIAGDVPVDRFIREQIAGDLLPDPRIDSATGVIESALGIGHLRMVPHGFTPTDALDEMVTFTDNQIDVISKAFLGLTVSCARCHNHKFDAISQADFYALFGVLASCRPALIHADAPGTRKEHRAELATIKAAIRPALADAWMKSVEALPAALGRAAADALASVDAAKAKLAEATTPKESEPAKPEAEKQARAALDKLEKRLATFRKPDHPLSALVRLEGLTGEPRQAAWNALRAEAGRARLTAAQLGNVPPPETWLRYGAGVDGPSLPGEFRIEPAGDRFATRLLPAGIHSNLLVAGDGAVLHSPRFVVENDSIRLLVAGEGQARVRLVVRNFPRDQRLLYPAATLDRGIPEWITLSTKYWRGEEAHLEIATAGDLPVEKVDGTRSWFSIMAVDTGTGEPPTVGLPPASLFDVIPADDAGITDVAPADSAALAALYQRAVRPAIAACRDGMATNREVRLLDALLDIDALPTDVATVPDAAEPIARYRTLDSGLASPVRAPGVVEGTVFDQPLFVRGDHKQPADPVPRRFLEAIDPRPFAANESGRRELADRLVASENPLTPRVFVNRAWHHLFGRGIVATVDNFGQMGDLPSHPELLDFIASDFVSPTAVDSSGSPRQPWSLKSLVRLLATSRAFRLAVQPSESARRLDPTNTLVSHARLRRLEGESIRDALMAVSGRLDRRPFGPSEPGGTSRRALYIGVIRNQPDPFLSAFDPPSTQSTQGRRDESHVPAQALVLMNSPFVRDLALKKAERLVAECGDVPTGQRIERLFVEMLGREPTAGERAASLAWIDDLAKQHGISAESVAAHAPLWADVVHALFNTEEFIHVD
jgi:cytochrome c553